MWLLRSISGEEARWRSPGVDLGLGSTHKPLSSSFLGLLFGILNINHKKELPRGLWVGCIGALSQQPCHKKLQTLS